MNGGMNGGVPNVPSYLAEFLGLFHGLRSWSQLESLWNAIRRDAGGGWYLYDLEQGPPDSPSGADDVEAFIAAMDAKLHEDHPRRFGGFIYADDPEAPGFVKIFDARKYGGCGHGTGPALPDWILCKTPPIDLTAATSPAGKPGGWWKSVLGKLAATEP
ncbi:MAG: hypothetical protein HQL33_05065 [Alphaproteobacteria bacterium]|nr:hypothetical protein [Alphaproteobacteria bacterium]